MKKIALFLAAMLAGMGLCCAQQTMWVTTGHVQYGFDTQQVGTMTYSAGGDSLTIQNKTFAVSDIDSIHVASGLMEYNTVLVTYADTTAHLLVAGNIADRVTVTVDGAHVSVLQDSVLVNEEIFYTLKGSSADGSFYQHGDFKATLILNGLNLTSTRGAAITIDDGKRIEIQVNEGTVNTLADCEKGTQKGCFVVEGHAEFKGEGTLILTGNSKHGFKGDEYVEFKKSFLGSLIVKNAVGDGLNTNQYLEMKAGNLIVEQCGGDGVQVDKKSDNTKPNNGQLIMSGGVLRVLATGDEGRALKIEDLVTINGGIIEATSVDNAINSKGSININGGNIYAYSSGGNGIHAAVNLTVAGGTIVAYGASTTGYGIRGANRLVISGGTVAAMGAMSSTPKSATTNQPALVYKGVLTQDTHLALSDSEGNAALALTVTRAYSSSKNHTLLLTSPAIAVGTTYTLASGATIDTEADNWHSLYGGEAVTAPGERPLGSATAARPYATLQ